MIGDSRTKVLFVSCMLNSHSTYTADGRKTTIPLRDWEWFESHWDVPLSARITLDHVSAVRGDRLPPLSQYAGLVVGGSKFQLSEGIRPWVRRLMRYVEDAANRSIPVLGICFGHQLLALMGGAKVVQQKTREFGTVEVELTEAGRQDPLFNGLPSPLSVLMSHREVVEEPGPGIVALAENAYNAHQAIALSEHVRGVQFHPEYPMQVMQALLANRREEMAAEGLDVTAFQRPLTIPRMPGDSSGIFCNTSCSPRSRDALPLRGRSGIGLPERPFFVRCFSVAVGVGHRFVGVVGIRVGVGVIVGVPVMAVAVRMDDDFAGPVTPGAVLRTDFSGPLAFGAIVGVVAHDGLLPFFSY